MAKKRARKPSKKALFAKRSAAAKKRARKPSKKALFAKRSAAAKKGWATRRAREDEDDEEDADDDDELAALYRVLPGDIAALRDAIGEDADAHVHGVMTRDELTEYIDDLFDVLTKGGWDLDVSDLWDMYYGYVPGSHGAA